MSWDTDGLLGRHIRLMSRRIPWPSFHGCPRLTLMRALGKWRVGQETYQRHTGSQVLAVGEIAIYRTRAFLAGNLAGEWADFG